MILYNDTVMDYFFHADHAGRIATIENNCLVERAGVQDIYLYVEFDKKNKNIIKARFKAKGSPYTIAGLEWLCRMMEAQKLDKSIKEKEIMEVLGMPALRYPEALQLAQLYNQLMKRIDL